MSLVPLHINPTEIHNCVGAIVNKHDKHWIALRSIGGQIYVLDSSARSPQVLNGVAYRDLITKHPSSFPIVSAQEMKR